jgi:hypothetical protein
MHYGALAVNLRENVLYNWTIAYCWQHFCNLIFRMLFCKNWYIFSRSFLPLQFPFLKTCSLDPMGLLTWHKPQPGPLGNLNSIYPLTLYWGCAQQHTEESGELYSISHCLMIQLGNTAKTVSSNVFPLHCSIQSVMGGLCVCFTSNCRYQFAQRELPIPHPYFYHLYASSGKLEVPFRVSYQELGDC